MDDGIVNIVNNFRKFEVTYATIEQDGISLGEKEIN